MRIYFVLLFIFTSACTTTNNKKETIKVVGEGKVRAKPNQVILTIQVAFTEPAMAVAVSKTQTTVDSVVKTLLPFATTETDIKTGTIAANKAYRYNGRIDEFFGYQALQTIDFVLNDIDKFTNLTGKLLVFKISSISNIQFTHSKKDSLFREADLLAYDDALQSAKKLCSRANVQLDKIVYISNVDGNNNNNYGGYISDEINTYNKAYGGNGFKVSPQVLEFNRKVFAEYGIKN
jgi:uncharacterized protein